MYESVKKLILTGNYIVLNKILIKKLGIEATLLLSALADGEEIAEKKGYIYDGWFFQTVEKLQEITTLSKHKQSKGLKKLEKAQLIERKNMGIPCKRYFKINSDILWQYLFENIKENNSIESLKNPQASQKLTSREKRNRQLEINKLAQLKTQNLTTRTKKNEDTDNPKMKNIYKENNIKENNNKEYDNQENELDYFNKLFKKLGIDFTTTNQEAILKLLKTMKPKQVTDYIMELYNNLSQNPQVKNIAAVFSQKLKEGKRQLSSEQLEQINKKEKKMTLLDKFRAMDEYDRLKIEEKAMLVMNFNNVQEMLCLREKSYESYVEALKIGIIKVMQEQEL